MVQKTDHCNSYMLLRKAGFSPEPRDESKFIWFYSSVKCIWITVQALSKVMEIVSLMFGLGGLSRCPPTWALTRPDINDRSKREYFQRQNFQNNLSYFPRSTARGLNPQPLMVISETGRKYRRQKRQKVLSCSEEPASSPDSQASVLHGI